MTKNKFTIFVLVLSFFSLKEAYAIQLCDPLLGSSDVNSYENSFLDKTDRFISYLSDLLEEGIMEDDHLSYLISGLEEGRVLNPFKDQGGSAVAIQGAGIQKFIDGAGLDKDRLLEWARQSRMDRNRIWVVRDETRKGTQDIYQKMVFHPVRVGSFQMGSEENKVAVRLTYPIEVMSTQVTQMHWVELMGKNRSQFKEGKHSIVVFVDGQPVRLQPDHPVENVSWWSALVFANRLSEKHGFTPTYDLSGIKWTPDTSARDGNLSGLGGEIKIFANEGVHNPYHGNIYYQAEGYRLPTEAEQEFLLRAGGTANGKYYFGESDTKLADHAWYQLNSGRKTHPVAELAPLTLGGKEFYDLHGNVLEWGWDWNGGIQKGENPVGPERGSHRSARGGSWRAPLVLVGAGSRQHLSPGTWGGSVGFRLVRTLRSP